LSHLTTSLDWQFFWAEVLQTTQLGPSLTPLLDSRRMVWKNDHCFVSSPKFIKHLLLTYSTWQKISVKWDHLKLILKNSPAL